jgi:hypothetical protein
MYTLALSDALYMIQEDIKSKSLNDLKLEYKAKLTELQPPLASPRKCQGYHCERKSYCFTDYKPHYSKNLTLSELLVGTTNWTYDAGSISSIEFVDCFLV